MSELSLSFDAGTIRVEGAEAIELPALDLESDPRSNTGRLPAVQYAQLVDRLREQGVSVDDRVFDLPDLDLDSAYQLREYQEEALTAWRRNDNRGVLELPTGSGKTVIGLAAIEALGTPTLVVVPTIDLLDQWGDELAESFDVPIGRLGGGTQQIEDITVSTYDSAYLRAEDIGDRFGLVVFDEVHHLGGEGYRDIARLLAAPARLGLTATFE
ncbi:MAG: DEAD/DEAH box helicase family protein, partial [Halovenus sp.]